MEQTRSEAAADRKARKARGRWLLHEAEEKVRIARGNVHNVLTSAAKAVRSHGIVTEAGIEHTKNALDRAYDRHREAIEGFHDAREKAKALGVDHSGYIRGIRT